MVKKNFTVKISRTIKEYYVMNVPALSAQKARTIAEYEVEKVGPDDDDFDFQRDPKSLPGKITTEIVPDEPDNKG
jgi:hypothetical protein